MGKELSRPDLWDNQEKARRLLAEEANLRDTVQTYESIYRKYKDIEELYEISLLEHDADIEQEIIADIQKLRKMINRLEEESLLAGEFDSHDAVVSIHPGAGGLESQDWAEMLLRMYLRWAENRGFKVDLNEVQPGEGGGIKSATFTVHGRNAYGLFSSEKGVHRLVRISPYDASRRRHTSFASLDVIPLIDEEIQVEIDPKDLRIETFRSSGAGGQHVNVTDSAVRITHLPTGIVATCQNERSQISNRDTAMRILRARLFERARREREDEIRELRGARQDIGFGSQIRSYILHPYRLVKDHRTSYEEGNVDAVLDGELDEFVDRYLHWKVTRSPNQQPGVEKREKG
jgi:peptide chain release factor 2